MRGKFFKDKPRDEEEYYLGSYLSKLRGANLDCDMLDLVKLPELLAR